MRSFRVCILVVVLLALLLPAASASADESCVTHPENPEWVLCGNFLSYWNANGGLPVFGYPVSAQFEENGLQVQYFERQRLEHHPELAGTEYEFLLGRLGAEEAERRGIKNEVAFQPTTPTGNGQVYFSETQHNATALNHNYWENHGLDLGDPGISFRESLLLFGYPISEEYWDDRLGLSVQYYERARFEYHPENDGTPYVVLFGLLVSEPLGPDGPSNLGPGKFRYIGDDGWVRLVTDPMGVNCRWDNLFKVTMANGAIVDFPNCGEIRFQGTGIVHVEIKSDTGYPADQFLVLWPQVAGVGEVSVMTGPDVWTGWMPTENAYGGIDLGPNTGVRVFEINMVSGSVSLLLGPGGPGAF